MLNKIISVFITKNILSFYLIIFNFSFVSISTSFQSKLELNLEDFKKFSGRYLITDNNNFGKEFTLDENRLVYIGGYKDGKRNGKGVEYNNFGIIKFKGEYLNGKRNGKGEEYKQREENTDLRYNNIIDDSDIIFEGFYKNDKKNGFGRKYEYPGDKNPKFEGEYLNDLKEGLGKQYFSNGKLKFQGEYKKGKKWNGKGYDLDGNIIYELIDGKGLFKKYEYHPHTKNNFNLLFEGEYLNGEKNGKGKEYEYYNNDYFFSFEGEYKNGKKNGKGKNYYYNKKIKFDGEYKEGMEWDGKGYDLDGKEIYEIKNGQGYKKLYSNNEFIYFEGEYKEGKKNGKGIEYNKQKGTSVYKTFEGIFKNGELYEGKLGKDENIYYEGTFLNGEEWDGIYLNPCYDNFYENEKYLGQYKNGK